MFEMVVTDEAGLGEAGVVAVRPGLAALLADPEIYALSRSGQIGHDSFQHFTRIA